VPLTHIRWQHILGILYNLVHGGGAAKTRCRTIPPPGCSTMSSIVVVDGVHVLFDNFACLFHRFVAFKFA